MKASPTPPLPMAIAARRRLETYLTPRKRKQLARGDDEQDSVLVTLSLVAFFGVWSFVVARLLYYNDAPSRS